MCVLHCLINILNSCQRVHSCSGACGLSDRRAEVKRYHVFIQIWLTEICRHQELSGACAVKMCNAAILYTSKTTPNS